MGSKIISDRQKSTSALLTRGRGFGPFINHDFLENILSVTPDPMNASGVRAVSPIAVCIRSTSVTIIQCAVKKTKKKMPSWM